MAEQIVETFMEAEGSTVLPIYRPSSDSEQVSGLSAFSHHMILRHRQADDCVIYWFCGGYSDKERTDTMLCHLIGQLITKIRSPPSGRPGDSVQALLNTLCTLIDHERQFRDVVCVLDSVHLYNAATMSTIISRLEACCDAREGCESLKLIVTSREPIPRLTTVAPNPT